MANESLSASLGRAHTRHFYADACLMASAPELLNELKAAHQIIRNALACMSTEQKSQWGMLNAADCVDGEGIARAIERAAVMHAATVSIN